MASALLNFIRNKMQMSHIYQPVMLKKLLLEGGQATEREIAKEILAHDESQIEYYEKVVRDMVGRVLRRHGIVERDRKTKVYSLVDRVGGTEESEVAELVAELDARLESFVMRRRANVWQHRKSSAGYITGTIRYEVLKRAKSRCELCGVSHEERALEVDHILPRTRILEKTRYRLRLRCHRRAIKKALLVESKGLANGVQELTHEAVETHLVHDA